MELTQIEILQGTFSLIFVIITIILAITIMLKYLEKKIKSISFSALGGLEWQILGYQTPLILY